VTHAHQIRVRTVVSVSRQASAVDLDAFARPGSEVCVTDFHKLRASKCFFFLSNTCGFLILKILNLEIENFYKNYYTHLQ
jgi:hypothetical protein